MLQLSRLHQDVRLQRSITGLKEKEFERLHLNFSNLLKEKEHPQGRRHTLSDSRLALVFILSYMKLYFTMDFGSLLYQVDRAQICRWVQQYLPLLKTCLGEFYCLPEEKMNGVTAFRKSFPEVYEVIIDATEQEVEKPKDLVERKQCYSGKKKRCSQKNTLMIDARTKRVLFVSPTFSGRVHDSTDAKQHHLQDTIPPEVKVLFDAAYQGFEQDNYFLPRKASKNNPLTEDDKRYNHLLARKRVLIEHVIAHIKRFKSLHYTFRNKTKGLHDDLILVAAALHNFSI